MKQVANRFETGTFRIGYLLYAGLLLSLLFDPED
jgi:hypothetical protein